MAAITQKTAKLHVNPEVAELVKIYCVLKGEKMTCFTSLVLEKELKGFKEKLSELRKIN